MNGFKEILKGFLLGRRYKAIPNNCQYKESAVLIPLVEEKDEILVLLTERSSNLVYHKGQMSFPGGKVDGSDNNLIETVLRETREEIGITEDKIEILGRLDDELTLVSGFLIHPFVGVIKDLSGVRINEDEVESILKVPLSFFLEIGSDPGLFDVPYEGTFLRTQAYVYEGKPIWGATFRIIAKFIELLEDLYQATDMPKRSNLKDLLTFSGT